MGIRQKVYCPQLLATAFSAGRHWENYIIFKKEGFSAA